jgi:hypothetical protein
MVELPIPVSCDTSWILTRVCGNVTNTEMQCLRQLRHLGAPECNDTSYKYNVICIGLILCHTPSCVKSLKDLCNDIKRNITSHLSSTAIPYLIHINSKYLVKTTVSFYMADLKCGGVVIVINRPATVCPMNKPFSGL